MRNCLIAILILVVSIPCISEAQKAGSILAGLEVGITSAVGDFRSDSLEAGTGVGFGADLKYTILNGFSLGPFIRYSRFGSSIQSSEGNISYNFVQYGGMAKFNVMDVSGGKLYVTGGGGVFTPKRHTWTTDYTVDESFESGTFFTGGIGLSSNPNYTTIYEFEIRYQIGKADYETTILGTTTTETFNFDCIYIGAKLSFNSKGAAREPRY